MFKFMTAALVAAFVFLAPVKSEAYGIADSFTYNNAPTHVKHEQRRYRQVPKKHVLGVPSHRVYRDGRPRAWCGWYMRQVLGVSNPAYNMARHWVTYGAATNARIGAVVVWPHHVGYIVSKDRRGWIVRSGNWNNRVADVPLSRMGRPIAFRG